LGDVYLKNNQPGKAMELYEKSLKLDPSKADVKKKLEEIKRNVKK
jgi:cytochrome c-type biogenesis protein CcmH/NrfG